MHDPEHDPCYANFSKELTEARRAMRKELLQPDRILLKNLYYRVLMLSEHEARRQAFLESDAAHDPTFSPDKA